MFVMWLTHVISALLGATRDVASQCHSSWALLLFLQ